jgi:hypothetical protein
MKFQASARPYVCQYASIRARTASSIRNLQIMSESVGGLGNLAPSSSIGKWKTARFISARSGADLPTRSVTMAASQRSTQGRGSFHDSAQLTIRLRAKLMCMPANPAPRRVPGRVMLTGPIGRANRRPCAC